MRTLVEFFFPKKIHRLGYLARILTTNLALGVILAVSSAGNHGYWIIAVVLLGIYQLLFILLPRLRDTGMSGWWVLLSLVPVVYVFLAIILIFRAPEYH